VHRRTVKNGGEQASMLAAITGQQKALPCRLRHCLRMHITHKLRPAFLAWSDGFSRPALNSDVIAASNFEDSVTVSARESTPKSLQRRWQKFSRTKLTRRNTADPTPPLAPVTSSVSRGSSFARVTSPRYAVTKFTRPHAACSKFYGVRLGSDSFHRNYNEFGMSPITGEPHVSTGTSDLDP